MQGTSSHIAAERDAARRRLIWTALSFLAGFGATFLGRRLGYDGTSLDVFAVISAMPVALVATMATLGSVSPRPRDDLPPRAPR